MIIGANQISIFVFSRHPPCILCIFLKWWAYLKPPSANDSTQWGIAISRPDWALDVRLISPERTLHQIQFGMRRLSPTPSEKEKLNHTFHLNSFPEAMIYFVFLDPLHFDSLNPMNLSVSRMDCDQPLGWGPCTWLWGESGSYQSSGWSVDRFKKKISKIPGIH